MNRNYSLSLIFVSFSLATSISWACRCVPLTSEQAYKKADEVIVATVIKLEDNKNSRKKVTLEVHSSWKNKVDSLIQIYQEPSSCAFIFKTDSKYLLYLNKHGNNLYTSICAGNEDFSSASKKIDWINSQRSHTK